ncbi:hypothetical protein MLD38_020020 [Melastoma candidum]|uniref:Uncharacterized protein n=1 Tax=Melastoma candidum TaxID=119954 RepID=A0ACB9QBP4_9MYRT|nr:hypothetical protein MLD38_020020 [Melastoma candidum]
MAQLPPKIPNVPPIWQEFPKLPHHHPYAASGNCNGNGNPSWVDEFLDFSSARRGAHRRSVSESIAFLEAPLLENCRGVEGVVPCSDGGNAGGEFDRFDDEQFVSMFTDEILPSVVIPTLSSSNPSSPSDHDCINEEKHGTPPLQQQQQQEIHPKYEPEEVQSPFESDYRVTDTANTAAEDALNESTERIVDPKRVKRILANRQSAQRSRVRKLQYISELERSVNTLQAEVSVLSPRVAFLDHQRLLLNVDNSALKQRIAALAQDKIFKDAHQEALRREIERLRQVYHQQNMLTTGDDNEGGRDVDCSNVGSAAAVSGSPSPRLSSDPIPPLLSA